MAPFWFWKPALYWNYNETLQCTHVILRKLLMSFVSLATKMKSWPIQCNPEVCIWSSLSICNAQGSSCNTKNTLLRLRGLFSLTETLSAQPLPQLLTPRKPHWIPSTGSHSCSSPSLLWSLQSKWAPSSDGPSASLQNMASFLSLLFIFPKCICANMTGFLFQPDKKKWFFLLQCVHFPRVRNHDIYIHLSQSILLYFWTGISVNPEED